MLRPLTLGLALAAAGCASTSQPVYRTSRANPSFPPITATPNNYGVAPRAALASELFACNGGGGLNIGPIGERGEAKLYTAYIHTPAGALLRNPAEATCLSSGFGWRGTADGGGRQHSGLDLANPNGGFVYAAADGWVSVVEWRGGYGLLLEIDHGAGVRSLYAHLSEVDPNLTTGTFVGAGAPVARMGSSGNATGVHLHYEVSIDGLKVDPLAYGVDAPAS